MTDLPDVKLKALVNFPASVTGRVATTVSKSNGQWFIDFDVSQLQKNTNISPGDVAVSWMVIWNEAQNAYQIVPYALAATSGVASLGGQTGALLIGYGLQFTSTTLSVKPRAQRVVTAAGAITADPADDIIIVRKTVGAATTVNVNWSARTRPLTIVDGKGDAATNNISIVPSAGQTQYGIADYVVVIDGNGGSVTLTPLADVAGAF